MRRFEFIGGGSSKFWETVQNGTEVTVHFGRIGSEGQRKTKAFDTWDAAAEHVRKMVAEKLREGYQEVGESGPGPEDLPGFRKPPLLPPYEIPSLPEDGPLALGNVQLPAGRSLRGDPQYAPMGVQPIDAAAIWATDGPVDWAGRSLYWLRQDAAALNLVPVLLAGMESEPTRPWDSHEFCPTDPRRVVLVDVRAELAHAWSQNVEGDDESQGEAAAALRPFGTRFPGLASRGAVRGEVRADGDVLDPIRGQRLALVAAERPADILAATGWMGAVNVHADPALLSAVLRSWETRWYARLVEIGFDTLKLTVGAPPRDERTALAIAAEHFALCPDNVWQGAGTLAEYAKALVGSRTWEFWFD